jgi:hypothetical protein
MLIKWSNFGDILSWRLRRENILTGDVLNEFYCILMYVSVVNPDLLIYHRVWDTPCILWLLFQER